MFYPGTNNSKCRETSSCDVSHHLGKFHLPRNTNTYAVVLGIICLVPILNNHILLLGHLHLCHNSLYFGRLGAHWNRRGNFHPTRERSKVTPGEGGGGEKGWYKSDIKLFKVTSANGNSMYCIPLHYLPCRDCHRRGEIIGSVSRCWYNWSRFSKLVFMQYFGSTHGSNYMAYTPVIQDTIIQL